MSLPSQKAAQNRVNFKYLKAIHLHSQLYVDYIAYKQTITYYKFDFFNIIHKKATMQLLF